MISVYWLIRRAWCRHLWRQRRMNWGAFLDALHDAPPWIERNTESWWSQMQWKVRRWKRGVFR